MHISADRFLSGLMARYRCVHCGQESDGPERRVPPCAACGRQTVRIVEPVDVIVVKDWNRPASGKRRA